MAAWSCRRAREERVEPSPAPSPTAAAILVHDTGAVVAAVRARVTGGKRVSLAGLGLTELPVSAIAVLGTVEELDLSRNSLAALPPEIGTIPGLVALDVSNNRLADLPAGLALRYLNVQSNPIAEIPEIAGLETLYLDRIDDAGRLLAMTSLQAVGVDWKTVHAGSTWNDVSLAHAWRGTQNVPADLPGKAVGSGSDVFLAPAKPSVRLVSDEAPGRGACTGLTLGTMRGIEESEMRARVANACAPLFAWSADGPAPISFSALKVSATPTDGCDESRREFELLATARAGGWFLASNGMTPRRPAVPAAKMKRASEGMALTSGMTLPPGFALRDARWFVHPEGGAQLALLDAKGFGGDYMPLVRMEWRGLFLVTKSGVVRLAESDPYPKCAGPHLFDLAGMIDFGGDGDLDIVLTGEEPMLLERVEGGFRTHAPMRVPCSC